MLLTRNITKLLPTKNKLHTFLSKELCRDSIRLNYVKNKLETLSGPILLEHLYICFGLQRK